MNARRQRLVAREKMVPEHVRLSHRERERERQARLNECIECTQCSPVFTSIRLYSERLPDGEVWQSANRLKGGKKFIRPSRMQRASLRSIAVVNEREKKDEKFFSRPTAIVRYISRNRV